MMDKSNWEVHNIIWKDQKNLMTCLKYEPKSSQKPQNGNFESNNLYASSWFWTKDAGFLAEVWQKNLFQNGYDTMCRCDTQMGAIFLKIGSVTQYNVIAPEKAIS